MNLERARRELVAASRALHGRGWVPATSGNFSARLGDGDIAITASGRDKGALAPADILRIAADGTARDDRRPSAETLLHVQLYRRDPEIRAVLHTHSVTATAVSMRADGALEFAGLEILKAFAGIDTHETAVRIPVFVNSQDIGALAAEVDRDMETHGSGVGYLIAGHGVYTWGSDVAACLRHLEALEHLFEYHRLTEGSRR